MLPWSVPQHIQGKDPGQHLNGDVLDIAEEALLEQYEKPTDSGVSVQNDVAPNDKDMLEKRETENGQLDQLSVEDSGIAVHTTRRTSWKEPGTGSARDETPSPVHCNADDAHFLNRHALPPKHLPGYAYSPHQCPFHPQQADVGVSRMTAPSLTPSTMIIYDHSRHTTHHGSHNYQGQNVNQSPSSAHGLAPARVPPQNIYMKHFNGNEIHCEYLLLERV